MTSTCNFRIQSVPGYVFLSDVDYIITSPSGKTWTGKTKGTIGRCISLDEPGAYNFAALKNGIITAQQSTIFKSTSFTYGATLQISSNPAWNGSLSITHDISNTCTPDDNQDVDPDCPDALFFDWVFNQQSKIVTTPTGNFHFIVQGISPDLSGAQFGAAINDGTPFTFNLSTGATWTHPEGWKFKLIATESNRVKICFNTGAPIIVPPIEPPPIIEECVFPTLSLNFSAVMSDIAKWLICQIKKIFKPLFDFLTAAEALIPQLLALLSYVLSLKWISDVLNDFFARLDVWFSLKFGIDPALPFWDELIKKAFTWISEKLDAAAQIRIQVRKW